MSRVFYTADTHFGHKRIIELCERPFTDVDDMNDQLVERWNDVVKHDDDIVFHLGDVTGGSLAPLEHVRRLRGRKILVAGNHDACHPMHREWLKALPRYLEAGFEAVMPFATRKVEGVRFLLSHLPYAGAGDHTLGERYTQYRLPDEGMPLVHGHVHTLFKMNEHGLNVGVDQWQFAPIPEDIIFPWIRLTAERKETKRVASATAEQAAQSRQ